MSTKDENQMNLKEKFEELSKLSTMILAEGDSKL